MKYVAYYRVSTAKQGRSGLGLEAQQRDVAAWVASNSGSLLGEYVEVESGKKNDRPELAKALKLADLTGATLIVAKLDRLSRNAAFLLTLKDSGVQLKALDCPDIENPITLAVMAGMAQRERELISERTKKALARKKEELAAKREELLAAGLTEKAAQCRLGNPNGAASLRNAHGAEAGRKVQSERATEYALKLSDLLADMKEAGLSLRAMAQRLTEQGILTQRGGSNWTATGVRNVLNRLCI